MYVMTDRVGAIVLMVLSLWCLGSWPAFFNVLERRGRVPMHTYMDYTIATYCVAIGFALTLGEIGPSSAEYPNFTTQLFQDNGPSVAFAMGGGLALCLGNISMQYALAFVGISLTEVVSASLAVVVGTSVNYVLDGGMNCAVILFPGVACFLVAVVLGSFCHASNAADITLKLNSKQIVPYRSEDLEETTMNVDFTDCVNAKLLNKQCFTEGIAQVEEGKGSCSSEEWGLETAEAAVGSAEFLQNLEDHRAIKIKGRSVGFGLGIALFSGGCYALFSPLFNLATNDQFHLLKPNVPHLVVYTTFFYFSTSFFICAMVINIYLLYHPLLDIPKSSLRAYLRDWKGRDLAVLAGLVCGFGNGFQFMGGQAAGYAAADAVQALPLVGTLWGILLFGEYHKSSRRTYMLLSAMLIMFGIAVTLLIASSRQRD
ncbi:hypothetical protein BDL97_03G028300 [Sphagnum fallax]|nr:hypothetical protein BDL97_03G028300 [Sphagnum fallax]